VRDGAPAGLTLLLMIVILLLIFCEGGAASRDQE
jgi:hypothetical protein